MNRNIVRAPNKETVNTFKEVQDYISKNKTKDEKRLTVQQREAIKMPYKMYTGIKKSVAKKKTMLYDVIKCEIFEYIINKIR